MREEASMTDTCVCCGAPVPEGRMVCPECEIETEERYKQMENLDLRCGDIGGGRDGQYYA